jgi:hypothetical protein
MDPLRPSRLRADYEKLEGNSFWVEFLERVKKSADMAEKAPVHLDLLVKDSIIQVAQKKGAFEAFRSVLGLPDVILDNPVDPDVKR